MSEQERLDFQRDMGLLARHSFGQDRATQGTLELSTGIVIVTRTEALYRAARLARFLKRRAQ